MINLKIRYFNSKHFKISSLQNLFLIIIWEKLIEISLVNAFMTMLVSTFLIEILNAKIMKLMKDVSWDFRLHLLTILNLLQFFNFFY